MLYTVFKI